MEKLRALLRESTKEDLMVRKMAISLKEYMMVSSSAGQSSVG